MKRFIILFLLLWSAAAVATAEQIVLTASGAADDFDYVFVVALENCTDRDADSLGVGTVTGGSTTYGWQIVFDNVTIPKNSTVSSAVLRVQTKRAVVGGATEGLHAYVDLIQADNNNAPSTGCYNNTGVWTYDNASWAANETIDITLFSTQFTTLFARAGWASGNSLTIDAQEAASSDRIMWLKSIASYAHTLTINYTEPATGSISACRRRAQQ